MKNLGGNTTALVQVKTSVMKNAIGERENIWTDATSIIGWLDYQGGQNTISTYNAKIQETTHIFICSFFECEKLKQEGITSENCRIVIDDNIYQVLLIDDPMNLHQHLEIFLKYVGGGLCG